MSVNADSGTQEQRAAAGAGHCDVLGLVWLRAGPVLSPSHSGYPHPTISQFSWYPLYQFSWYPLYHHAWSTAESEWVPGEPDELISWVGAEGLGGLAWDYQACTQVT